MTREAFARYMRVIKRALTDAAAKESSKAAGVTAGPPGTTPETPASSSGQAAGASNTHAMYQHPLVTLRSHTMAAAGLGFFPVLIPAAHWTSVRAAFWPNRALQALTV